MTSGFKMAPLVRLEPREEKEATVGAGRWPDTYPWNMIAALGGDPLDEL